ncbi:hypothetical protein STAS_06912 [Striga asiatica]|uniref:Uncharacterized protein n=1 Tax=Striga asiatica TaxID=4170 RepID=A0A5A7PE26_STRAF|nr:hypothetical protein STAS_06912 [Striga asiatica]
MDNIGGDERWDSENAVELQETAETETEEEYEDETLSFSALPLIPKNTDKEEQICNRAHTEDQIHEDFDFCSVSKESEMCAADEIFFGGQILPLRHSISSDRGLLPPQRHHMTRSVSRSESMDHLYCDSAGLISSRSSSIGSHQSSSSSGSGSSGGRPEFPPARNQFHSYPSPSPRIHLPSKRRSVGANRRSGSAKRSPAWSIFRLGILAAPPPDIAFQDLKPRASSRGFGSRNSTESSGSSAGSSSVTRRRNLSLLGGCKCSADVVDNTVRGRVVVIKRSAGESGVDAPGGESGEGIKPAMGVKKRPARKQSSHHRTSEWLKQLSLDDAAGD